MKKIFTSNILKIIAFISMFLDHTGKILEIFYVNNTTISIISYIFSIIGRITFPIIIFLLIEGFNHTSSLKKYFLRLGTMAIIIGLSEIIISTSINIRGASLLFDFGNIFIDLILSLLFLYLINDKSITKKLLSLVVIAYFVVSLLLQNDTIYLSSNLKNIFSGFMPQYSFMTPIILIIYIGIFKTIKHFKFDNFSENEISSFDSNAFLLEIRKYSFILSIIIFSLLSYIFTYIDFDLNMNFSLGTYFFLSTPFIYLYNGKEGKKSPLIKTAYYLFYPLHISLIYLIVFLINL